MRFSLIVLAYSLLSLSAVAEADVGDYDNTFGAGGTVTTRVSTDSDIAFATTIQRNQRILLGGVSGGKFALVRLHPDGSLDSSFGNGGIVLTDVGVFTSGALALHVLSDQRDPRNDVRIVAVGTTAGSTSAQFVMVRYTMNGALDTTFNSTGYRLTPFAGRTPRASSFAFHRDGVLVAGSADARFSVWRFTADGTTDTSFNGRGVATHNFGSSPLSSSRALGIAVQPDDRIVAVGESGDFIVARFNTDGTLDTTFGTGGRVATTFAAGRGSARAAIVQPDGKVLVVGRFSASQDGFALARFLPNGSRDGAFGTGGRQTTIFDVATGIDALMLQQDGKILAVGNTTDNYVVVARYDAAGQIDPSFGSDGKTKIRHPSGFTARAARLLPNGMFLLAGSTLSSSNDFAISRHNTGTLLRSATGRVSLLRAHDGVTGLGNAPDRIDVDVVVQLASTPGQAYGFKRANDEHQAMFGLLRDALNHGWDATLTYIIDPGDTNGEITSVSLTR